MEITQSEIAVVLEFAAQPRVGGFDFGVRPHPPSADHAGVDKEVVAAPHLEFDQ